MLLRKGLCCGQLRLVEHAITAPDCGCEHHGFLIDELLLLLYEHLFVHLGLRGFVLLLLNLLLRQRRNRLVRVIVVATAVVVLLLLNTLLRWTTLLYIASLH
jgi:hypothetical protein